VELAVQTIIARGPHLVWEAAKSVKVHWVPALVLAVIHILIVIKIVVYTWQMNH
jgi:hypothetical protein